MEDGRISAACEKDCLWIEDDTIFPEIEKISLLEKFSFDKMHIETMHSRLLHSASELDVKRHKIPLLKSLFSHKPPTLYFMLDKEEVGCFSADFCHLLKWKFCKITPKVIRDCVKRTGFKITRKNPNWLGLWGKHMKSIEFRTIQLFQKVNHFPGTYQIGRKDKLWENFSSFQAVHGVKNFNFMPQTFVLPNDLSLLRRHWREGKRKWIVKPPASARGKGIKVISSWNELPKKQFIVVQRYIINPYLINGSKFDLRVYVYVSCFNPLRVYVFNDGLVRFATRKYSSRTMTLSDKYIHLTNYSVNKKNKKVYKQPGMENNNMSHKWSLKELWAYFDSNGIKSVRIWEEIKDIAVKTIICGEYLVNSQVRRNTKSRYNCHELFGFDIILDSNLKPWLLEVNISPSLHSTSSTDLIIKSQLVKDLLNIAGFQLPKCLLSSEDSYLGNEFNSSESLTGYQVKNLKNLLLKSLSSDDINILIESEDELSRSGCFERIFPSTSSKPYLSFFKSPRHYNLLLDKWTQLYMRDTFQPLTGVCLLKALTDIKV